jgi:hypothetical protein
MAVVGAIVSLALVVIWFKIERRCGMGSSPGAVNDMGGHELPDIALSISAAAALISCITAVASALSARSSKRAKDLAENITEQMYLQVARDPKFLDLLENNGKFVRSNNEKSIAACIGELLNTSVFLRNQVRGLINSDAVMAQIAPIT